MKKSAATRELKTQADAVLHFLQLLDIDMVSTLLDENRTYQEFDKTTFVMKLGAALGEFEDACDTFLDAYRGKCNSVVCGNAGKAGYLFVGNYSGNYFEMVMEIKDGVIQDMYECMDFKCGIPLVKRKSRIFIDKSKLENNDM